MSTECLIPEKRWPRGYVLENHPLMTTSRCIEKSYPFWKRGLTGDVPSDWLAARPENHRHRFAAGCQSALHQGCVPRSKRTAKRVEVPFLSCGKWHDGSFS